MLRLRVSVALIAPAALALWACSRQPSFVATHEPWRAEEARACLTSGAERETLEEVGVEFSESMLSWQPGLRETDGIWAKHWYEEVARSTSFEPYQAKRVEIPKHLREIHDRCRDCYERLYEHRLC